MHWSALRAGVGAHRRHHGSHTLFGPALGAIPAGLVALSIDAPKAILVIAWTLIIQGLESYLLVPRVMGKSIGVSPFVVILSLVAFTTLLGFPGALLAIPLAAVIEIFLQRLIFNNEPDHDRKLAGRDYAAMLRLEAQDLSKDVRMQLRQKESPTDENSDGVEDEVEAIASRLDNLLEQVSRSRRWG